jgi:hypothetical protein
MTGPLVLPPSCAVTIGGVRLPDGQPGDDPLAPTALDNLRVTWGRANNLDQPSPASLTVDVLDRNGGQTYLQVLRIGARIVVTAEATLYPAATQSQLTDPQFTAAPLGPLPGTTAGRAGVRAATVETNPAGGKWLRVDPAPPGALTWGPAPVTSPTSWDALPQSKAGQTWKFGATVTVPAGISATVLVRPVQFTRADLAGWSVCPGDPAQRASWTGGAKVITGTVVPAGGVWMGLQVVVETAGPRWTDLPAGQTWAATDPTWRWLDAGSVLVDDLVLLAPAAGTQRVGRVFSGRITDITAGWSADADAAAITVIAQDDIAELDNRYVGDVPWALEGLDARAQRILTAAGQQITLTTDATISATPVSRRDVDAQGAAGLLQSLARSVGGVLWNAASVATGSFLRIEDVNARAPMMKLVYDPALLLVVIAPVSGMSAVNSGGIVLDACEVLLDPVQWEQTTEDDASRIAVTWKDQTTAPNTTDRTELRVNLPVETATGQRRVGYSTELTTAVDAGKVADTVLARLTTPGWRISALTWALQPLQTITADELQRVMKVLDGVTRLGLPILLTNLPGWVPISASADLPLFLEGSTLTFTRGAWALQLVTSSARAQGQAGVRWTDLPASTDWQWRDFDPAITWAELTGVTV